jgi:hypothetical protein
VVGLLESLTGPRARVGRFAGTSTLLVRATADPAQARIISEDRPIAGVDAGHVFLCQALTVCTDLRCLFCEKTSGPRR